MRARYRRNQDVFVNLALVYGELGPQAVDPERPETLYLAGVVLGTLHGWYRSVDGNWLAVCSFRFRGRRSMGRRSCGWKIS